MSRSTDVEANLRSQKKGGGLLEGGFYWSQYGISLIRPKLEYSSHVWSPHQEYLKTQLEFVQKKAARFVLNRPHKRHDPTSRTESATAMVEELGWETLEERRKYQSLCLLYKIHSKSIDIPQSHIPSPVLRSTRGQHRLQQPRWHKEVFQYSFLTSTIPASNKLPESIALADSLESFPIVTQFTSK